MQSFDAIWYPVFVENNADIKAKHIWCHVCHTLTKTKYTYIVPFNDDTYLVSLFHAANSLSSATDFNTALNIFLFRLMIFPYP